MTLVNADKFYIPASRHAFIKKIQAGLAQSKIIAIEGQQGIGKTILIEEVLTLTAPDGNKCYLTAARSINDIQIRSRIIEQLFGNVLFDPEMPLLTSFIEFNDSTEMLIAIDNAHYLTGKMIGELLQLFSESKNLGIQLKIVMSFDKTIASTLMNVSSGFLQVLSVPLLTKQESYQLLAQYVIDIPAQTNKKIKRWIENSAGLPIQLLAYSDVTDKKRATENEPFNIKLWVSILVMGSLLLALGIYAYRMGLISEQEDVSVSPTDINTVKPWQSVTDSNAALKQQSLDTTEELSVPAKKMAKVVIRPTASSEQIFSELMAPKSKLTFGNQKVEQNQTTDMILAEMTKSPKLAQDDLNPQVDIKTDIKSDLLKQEPDILSPEIVTPDKSASGDIVLDNEQVRTEEPINMDFFLEPQAETSSSDIPDLSRIDDEPTLEQLINDSVNLIANQPKTKEIKNPYNIDNQAFFTLPPEQYVLQLTAVSSEPVLAKYLQSIPYAKEELRIYKVRRNSRDWIVVTYGLFETIELARKTAASIAPNAWAKSISVIQQQISAFDDAQSAQ
jgi:energy-coupling factor transporter ATP-binding protein EcfA2